MKGLIIIICMALCLVIVAAVSVPDDVRCLDEYTLQESREMANLIPGIVKRSALEVEHGLLYKKVVNRWTGQTVAVCCFGNVFNIE